MLFGTGSLDGLWQRTIEQLFCCIKWAYHPVAQAENTLLLQDWTPIIQLDTKKIQNLLKS